MIKEKISAEILKNMLRERFSIKFNTGSPSKLLPECLTVHIGFLLGRCGMSIREKFEEALAPISVTCRQFGILTLISERGSQTQTALRTQLFIDRTTMVMLVDELEERNLVQRMSNKSDSRTHLIKITNKGREILAQCRVIASGLENSFLQPLTPKECLDLHGLLLKLAVSTIPKNQKRLST